MTKEMRAIWCEDQYELLHVKGERGFFGVIRGDAYRVYERHLFKRERRWVQTVTLERDWYWSSEAGKLVAVPPFEATSTVRRREDVISGYTCEGEDGRELVRMPWIEDLSHKVNFTNLVLSTGAEVLKLSPQSETKSWVVSLHGGPESWEGREIRYGGLYRDLLRRGIGILVLNYVGSTNIANPHRAWKRWAASIEEDFEALMLATNLQSQQISLFGASFGGALALHLQSRFGCKQVVLSSPLLDLRAQAERAGDEFASWFESRFSNADFVSLSVDHLCQAPGPVFCFFSMRDEVLGHASLEKAQALRRDWSFEEQDCSHSPKTYSATRERFTQILEVLSR